MSFLRSAALAAILLVAAGGTANADDGLAGFKNGALVFGKSKTIEMVDETLTISRSRVTADFHFVNRGDAPETITIAFPLPDINTAASDGLFIPVEDNDNFVGFTTEIDGKPVNHGLEQRAFMPAGKDVTDALKALNIPLVRPYWTIVDQISILPQDTQEELVRIGAIVGEEGDVAPQWVTKSKFYFQHTFEPRKTVHIVHSYTPSLDTTNMTFYSGDMTPSGEQTKLYCLNDAVRQAVADIEKTKTGEFPYAAQFALSYILSTAKTWSGPIGHYRLVIDLEKPNVAASFCGDARRTSPTRYEFSRDKYVPDRDLDIIFFE